MENLAYKNLLTELRAELLLRNEEAREPLARFSDNMIQVRKKLNELKALVLEQGFESKADEIYFFKHIKPQMVALQLYEVLNFNLKNHLPAGTKEMVKAYYEEELLQVFRFFRQQSFHYQYYRLRSNELDELFFIRGAEPVLIPVLEELEPMTNFSTTMDYAFAKYIAYERLQDELLERLTDLYSEEKKHQEMNQGAKKTIELRWTGESINLVEIAYGLWLTGQLNEGNITITDIIHGLEEIFSIKIGVAYRRWTEISGRTHLTNTRFLDRMRESVQKRVDDELDVRNRKRKARRIK
jgi:hypothetical protein